ncbi:MAG: hypothetical protein H0W58_14660 [Acidobacteria bacterium]|jgi:hypothetical protein|nr:hypothetical protein [Acidobacteriota bacterium]
MVAKLTVIFFIILCLVVGIFLMLLPWLDVPGFGTWGENYFLTLIVQKTDLPIIQEMIASGWFRGAITGLGILNLFLAFWEMGHFKQSVQMLEEGEKRVKGQK